jgi:hypothetical protein
LQIGFSKGVPERLSGDRINVRRAKVGTFPNQTAMIELCIDITGKQQLDQVTAQMSKMAVCFRFDVVSGIANTRQIIYLRCARYLQTENLDEELKRKNALCRLTLDKIKL